MKWIIVSMLLFAMMFSAGFLYGEEDEKPNVGYGLMRGSVNICSGWLEVPRCLVYESVKLPLLGTVFGSIKGPAYALCRVIVGMTDFITLGLAGDILYSDDLPDFVWQADWLPKEKWFQ